MKVYANHFHNLSRPPGSPTPDYLVPDDPGSPLMKAGSNKNSKLPPAVIDSGGVTIECELISSPGLTSRTVYLISHDLAVSGFLRAELEFDKPNAPNGGDSNGWAIALNFKDGDETDRLTDTRSGPTCQFRNGGNTVKFNFTNATNPVCDLSKAGVQPGYANFGSTVFKLVVEVCRDHNNLNASYGELWINGTLVNQGALSTSVPALKDTLTDPTKLTAVGFAIVSKDGEQISTRFRSFTFKCQPGPCSTP